MSSYLKELCNFYDRMSGNPDSGMPPVGMTSEKISFSVVISSEGDIVRTDDLRTSKGKPVSLYVPAAVKRSSGIACNYLWDNTGYVFGVDGKGKPARTKKSAECFRLFHKQKLAECISPQAKAFLAFLEKWNPDAYKDIDTCEAMLDTNVIFKLDGDNKYLHEIDELKNLWLNSLNEDKESSDKAFCLITGKEAPIALVHPAIKGVVGAQSSGAALISFNCASFASYGKVQNANAPVAEDTARAYTTALNYLLQRDHNQMVRIGDTCIVFWADKACKTEKVVSSFFDFAPGECSEQDKEQLDRLKGILLSMRKGSPLNDAVMEAEKGTTYYILGIAPNASRLSIRFWFSNTLETFLRNVSLWYEDLSIERQFPDSEKEFPPMWLLLVRALAAQGKTENIPPEVGGQMARIMLSGQKFPENIYTICLQRIHADKKVNYYRAALIKAYLIRNKGENNDMTTLNPDIQSVGYRLGRLFAVLEKAQKDALGNVNASLRERYIGSASATPRLVFPMLLRLCQHHVTKVSRDFSGYEVVFNKRVNDIIGDMVDFPAVLPMDEQGRFILGYYHQTKALYEKKSKESSTESVPCEE